RASGIDGKTTVSRNWWATQHTAVAAQRNVPIRGNSRAKAIELKPISSCSRETELKFREIPLDRGTPRNTKYEDRKLGLQER
ncbi:hypothetical protein, partial [Escherichia coli]|uniref:hypothetical protein n=1 Tax=Escherichia coli TaxID=562 RepID=UPI003CE4BEAB